MPSTISFPDQTRCKTCLVRDDLYYCVTRNGHQCRHAIRLGNDFYCDHLNRSAFVRDGRPKGGVDEFSY